jgi:hypothetical protein
VVLTDRLRLLRVDHGRLPAAGRLKCEHLISMAGSPAGLFFPGDEFSKLASLWDVGTFAD